MRTMQFSLFANPVVALEGCEANLKDAMASVAAESKLSREQGCDRMNTLADASGIRLCANARCLSIALFEKWLNPADREHVPSIKAVQVFCCVYQTIKPWCALLQSFNVHVLGPEDMRFYNIGKAQVKFEEAKEQLKKAKARAKL